MSIYLCVIDVRNRLDPGASSEPGQTSLRGTLILRKLNGMSLAEIKDAVAGLSHEELAELTTFILAQEDPDSWDRQMARDAAAGKLDFLIAEAEQAEKSGTLKDWPSDS
jgi:hypothetical protein